MMTRQTDSAAPESSIQSLKNENELLLHQLHEVQEQLEIYYLRNQRHEKGVMLDPETSLSIGGFEDNGDLIGALSETNRLMTLVKVQQELHRLETRNTLSAQLGSLLIESVDSPKAFVTLPVRLGRIWRIHSKQTPPKSLGGKGFVALTNAYRAGGFDAVDKLMDEKSIPPAMRANGYTALGRHLLHVDCLNSAAAARRAYTLDPKPYRLKWLAFRLHEAGEVIEAQAMLDLLPADMQFSDSEARQATQLRCEASLRLQDEAKKQVGSSPQRVAIGGRIKKLEIARDEQMRIVADMRKEIDFLTRTNSALNADKLILQGQHDQVVAHVKECNRKLEIEKQAGILLKRENSAIVQRCDAAAELANVRGQEIESLNQTCAYFEREMAAISGRYEVAATHLASSEREVDALKGVNARLEYETLAVAEQRDNAMGLLVARDQHIDALKQVKTLFEQERQTLAADYAEIVELAASRAQEVEKLKQTKSQLEQERSLLAREKDEASRRSVAFQEQIEALKLAKAELSQQKASLGTRHEEVARLATDRAREIEALTRTQKQLEQEKSAIALKEGESSRLVIVYREQVEALQLAKAELSQQKASLGTRHEEVARLATDRAREIEALTRTQKQLEQEKSAIALKEGESSRLVIVYQEQVETLTTQIEEITRLAADRGREIEIMKQAKAKLEQEKALLQGRHDDTAKLAADHLKQISSLQQRLQSQQVKDVEVSTRQQLMHEEMAKAEAQIDLIKEMFLGEWRA
ncbi:hypothetical protein B0G69_5064 [Paraburkholderia sp. RAU2J]|uniref:hypothetical protein n=1 Tax=Paraburkholderia sp. RAU2J TaxID=1938810 RepID=UPI000EB3265C|nr:hypothetical protein [Paraburkholderia sp. RAU2J]RKT21663.1 hypothetical protein B0G69_5064 [Paraburkholderia sp. RAU2J]